jgi:hypothetical protein
MKMAKRRGKKSKKRKEQRQRREQGKRQRQRQKKKALQATNKEVSESLLTKVPEKRDIPVDDFLASYNFDIEWSLGECLDHLISSIKRKYFHRWEAVVRQEQGLPLTEDQQDLLDELITFYDEDDYEDEDEEKEAEPILYIDEMPRPSEPWYETLNKVLPRLVLTPFKTYETHYEIYHDGWIEIVECLEEHAQGLSLPEGITTPIDAISPNIRHRLWLQHAVNSLSGLGQEEDVTLANEEEESWRMEELIEALKECKESIEYFDLTLEGLFKFVELPPQDEKILVGYMRQELGLQSVEEKLSSVL